MSPTAVALPRLIELRSQFSKKLLRYVKEEGEVKGFVQFSGEHVGSPEAKFEVHSSETGNGLVHIRSCYNNRYLRVMDNNSWIAAKAEKPEEDQSKRSCTLLRPTCVDGDPKKIRLTNVHRGNNLCLWRAAEPYYACVLAIYSDPDPDSCDVFNVIDCQKLGMDRFMDARIYGESIAVMVSSSHINQGNTTHEQTFDLSYTDKKSNTWNSSISMKASYEMSYQVGLPLIFEGEIKLGLEIGGQYTWGETKEVEEKISSTYKLLVPPKTKVTARIMATRGTCDVPFSYTKRDVLYTGETVTTDMDDGVYTGVNNYSYYTEVKEESLINDPKITTAGFNKCYSLCSKITDVLSFSQDFFY